MKSVGRTGARASIGMLAFILLLASMAATAQATPEYSGRTGKGCKTCHLGPQGGALSETGLEYAASGYVWPPEGGFRVLGPIKKSLRFVIGTAHIVFAFLWFGTILYVHILLRPAYASKGLPRGEVVLGIVSMVVVGFSGVLLTISRVKGLDVLWHSPWGRVLSAKISVYIVMVLSAMFVVAFLGPRLKRSGSVKMSEPPADGTYDPATLSSFNGSEGRPAYIAHGGRVYDVTGLRLWKAGTHMKHRAGEDLTDALPKAPHGDEKLEGLKEVGTFDADKKPPRSPVQKGFYFIAYMNLFLVFVVLVLLSVWRWGL